MLQRGLRAGKTTSQLAVELERGTDAALQQARRISRAAGISRLDTEAASVGASLSRRSAVLLVETERDARRAAAAARSYAARWYRKAVGETEQAAAKAASVATQGSLRRIGVTESAESFNTGRAKYLRVARPLGLLRVWDATNDRRMCRICGGADGTIVGATESFPLGEPGGVHPYCRCSWSLLTSAEAGEETIITPAA